MAVHPLLREGVASRICSKELVAFSCSSHLAFSLCFFLRVQVVHSDSSINTASTWKKSRFILSDRSDFHMIDSLSIAVPAFN